MTKQEILDRFNDINEAYNDSSRYDSLSRMLDELMEEQEAKPVDVCGQMFTIKYGHCPKCGEGINSEAYPYWCGFCGQAVKWK